MSPTANINLDFDLKSPKKILRKIHFCANCGTWVSASGQNYGVYGQASGNTTEISYGVLGQSYSASGDNYGVRAWAGIASSGTNYGVYGQALNTGAGDAFAGYFQGDTRITGRLNHNWDLQIATQAGAEVAIGTTINTDRKLNIYTNVNTHAVVAEAANTSGINVGLWGRATGNTTDNSVGVSGTSSSASGSNYGVRGAASTASSGTNYGVYGYGTNGGTGGAWAGYFQGNLYTSGNVGIGTTPPSRKLFVSGTAGGTSAWYNDSDARLKKDVVTIDGALEKVGKLRGVQFEWKDTQHHAEGKQIGFIAQETVGVVPEVVDIQDGNYTMQYAPLTALLVEAVKDLKTENDLLKQRLAALEELLLSGGNTAKGAE